MCFNSNFKEDVLVKEAKQKSKTPKLIVLLIEDSPTDRKVYRRYLEDQKQVPVEVVEVTTGEEALEFCRKKSPDCLVVDFKLPDTTATQLIPELRKISQAPIVFYTSQPEALAQTQAYRDGAVTCLSKDFLSSQTFVSAIFEALGIE